MAKGEEAKNCSVGLRVGGYEEEYSGNKAWDKA